MKHNKSTIPKEVHEKYNPGKMIHDQFGIFKFKSYEKAKQIIFKYAKNLSGKEVEQMHESAQLILKANKGFKLPPTEITFFKTNYPGLMKILNNFLDPHYHSELKTTITGV